jgi:intron-binding protein aquarius
LLKRPTKLALVTDEMYTASHSRRVDAEVSSGSEAVMEGVEHLGQYVYEMTKAKLQAPENGNGNGDADADAGGDVHMAGAAGGSVEDAVLAQLDSEAGEEVVALKLDGDAPVPGDEEVLVKVDGEGALAAVEAEETGEDGDMKSVVKVDE